jgi:hypothetical protein
MRRGKFPPAPGGAEDMYWRSAGRPVPADEVTEASVNQARGCCFTASEYEELCAGLGVGVCQAALFVEEAREEEAGVDPETAALHVLHVLVRTSFSAL